MLMRCTWWHGQGRLGEQRAAHEQVEQAPGRNRGDQRRELGGEPTHRARQRPHRPEHQHHEHVADQGLGRQRHDSQDCPRSPSARRSVTGEPIWSRSHRSSRRRPVATAGTIAGRQGWTRPTAKPSRCSIRMLSSEDQWLTRLPSVSYQYQGRPTTAGGEVVEKSTGALGCRVCTNRRNRMSQPRRRCGGCSTSWRRSSRPGCAGRPSRSPWPRSAPRSVPPCCGSSSPAGSAPRRRCSPAPAPSAAAWSPAIRSSLSCGRPTAPSI
jgi:hypothetical protein